MKFGEKCRELRKQKQLTQNEVAESLGIGRRTYIDYENNGVYPKKRQIYHKLAALFGVDVNYLLTEDEEFVLKAGEEYGRGGMVQAQQLVRQIGGLFAGGDLTEQDKDALMQALQQVYWDCKKENTAKYARKQTDGR